MKTKWHFYWPLGLSIWTLEGYLRMVTKRIFTESLATKDTKAQHESLYYSISTLLITIGQRFLSPRFGMPSSSECTTNISSPSIMPNLGKMLLRDLVVASTAKLTTQILAIQLQRKYCDILDTMPNPSSKTRRRGVALLESRQ